MCEIRTTVFSWTTAKFPFHTSSAKKLTLDQTPVITVTGKAFFDVVILLKIKDQTGEAIFPATLLGRFTP